MKLSRCIRVAVAILALATLASDRTARAGGGPENVFLVVNSRSAASLTVANHYCQLRSIPPKNVLMFEWNRWLDSCTIDNFRRNILAKIFHTLSERQLRDQIDYIVYSSDFPYRMHIGGDFGTPPARPWASLTGMTFFAPMVMERRHGYEYAKANRYTPAVNPQGRLYRGSLGFRSSYQWNVNGQPVTEGGEKYYLSAMLAYTSGRGNSVDEVVNYLRRSATADATLPRGTIYFMRNKDVRSTTRDMDFPNVAKLLNKRGVRAEVLQGQVPLGKNDVQGAMMGVRVFDWARTGSRILPGALCEHFTSFGGVMLGPNSQTPLTEFLRFGAAGASGTVVEPFARSVRFPHPMLHLHYVQGCTLAESFYQSVYSPYKQLLVGDPLCRPWAFPPPVTVEGVKSGSSVKGKLTLTPSTTKKYSERIERYELFVDGRRTQKCSPGDSLTLDTTKLVDGYHRLRIVAIDSTPIETQGRLMLTINSVNRKRRAKISTARKKTHVLGGQLTVNVDAPGATTVDIQHNGRSVGLLTGARGKVSVDTRALGMGPVTLRAIAYESDRKTERAISEPLELEIGLPTRHEPVRARWEQLAPGGELTYMGSSKVISNTFVFKWLEEAGVRPNQPFELKGYVLAKRAGLHQLQLIIPGMLKVYVNGKLVLRETKTGNGARYLPLNLGAGVHHINIHATILGKTVRLSPLFGSSGTFPLDKDNFRHAK